MLATPLAWKIGVAGLPWIGKAIAIPLVPLVGVPVVLITSAVVVTALCVTKEAPTSSGDPNGVNPKTGTHFPV